MEAVPISRRPRGLLGVLGLGRRVRPLALGVAVLSLACGSAGPAQDAPTDHAEPRGDRDQRRSQGQIVVLGDSLAAGLGIRVSDSFPAVLQRRIYDAGYAFEVINSGRSADTTAGGVRRLDWALDGDVRILIIALGANDGLRGLSIAEMRRNLSTMIEHAQARGIPVLLTGMEALPNLGPEYTAAFRAVFRELAERYDTAFVPFLLAGVAGVPTLNQRDGVHPNVEGARRVADVVWAELQPLLEAANTE